MIRAQAHRRWAGTAWAIVLALNALNVRGAPAASGAKPRAELYRELTARHAALDPRWPVLAQTRAEIQAWLDEHAIVADDLPTRRAEIATERERRFAIVTRLEASVSADLQADELDPATLQLVLTSRTLELQQLRTRITALQQELRTQPTSSGLQVSVALEGMDSRTFLLVGDRIAPFRAPFFSSRLIKVRLADRTIAERRRFSRESDAGTIAAAMQPGGVLFDLVSAPDFAAQPIYLNLWVCADAIDGYRAVGEFLRAHHVRYTWTTDEDEPWVANDDGEALETWGYDAP